MYIYELHSDYHVASKYTPFTDLAAAKVFLSRYSSNLVSSLTDRGTVEITDNRDLIVLKVRLGFMCRGTREFGHLRTENDVMDDYVLVDERLTLTGLTHAAFLKCVDEHVERDNIERAALIDYLSTPRKVFKIHRLPPYGLPVMVGVNTPAPMTPVRKFEPHEEELADGLWLWMQENPSRTREDWLRYGKRFENSAIGKRVFSAALANLAPFTSPTLSRFSELLAMPNVRPEHIEDTPVLQRLNNHAHRKSMYGVD